ncbi:uncharacterized protein LOC144365777 [Ictidomys tridecemlineatus]
MLLLLPPVGYLKYRNDSKFSYSDPKTSDLAPTDCLSTLRPSSRSTCRSGRQDRVPPLGCERTAPCRPRSLEGARAKGRSRFPRILDRARPSAEPGTGCRTRLRGRPRREGLGADRVLERECGARLVAGQSSFSLGGHRSETASVNTPPCSSASWAMLRRWPPRGRGTRRGEPISCQASGGDAQGRLETHKERSGRRRRKGAANLGPQLLTALAPATAAGCWSEAAETMRWAWPGAPQSTGRPRSLGPKLTVSRLAQPPPGEGAPPRSGGGRRKSVRGRRAWQLASREKFAAPPRGGAGRRGAARPSRPRSPPVTF